MRFLRLALALAVAFPVPAAAVQSGPKLPEIGAFSFPVEAQPPVIASFKSDPAAGELGVRVAQTWDAASYLLKTASAPAEPEHARLQAQARAVVDAWKAAPAPADAPGAPAALQALNALIASLETPGASAARSQDVLDAAYAGARARVEARPDDVFTPMTKAQKADFLKRYVAHLKKRDGVPDPVTKRFSVREAFFDELAKNPVTRSGPGVDKAAYIRNEPLEVPETALMAKTRLAQRTLWALMTGKANRGEAFAVSQLMKRSDYKKGGDDNPMTWIAIEEFYHTRILKDALKVLGLDMRELPPPFVVKGLAYLMARLPPFISHTFVMASEVIGVATFRLLRDKARELFQDDPKSLARIDSLFQQIIVDEVGHVHYVRSQLGPIRLWIAKKLVPLALGSLMAKNSEAELLFGRKAMIDAAKAADIDGAAAEYPDRFVAFPKN